MKRQKVSEEELTMAKKVGYISLVRKSMAVYNRLCNRCKVKCVANPKRQLEDYCGTCKPMMEEMMGGFVK